MSNPDKDDSKSALWAWPVGIMLGLVIGLAALDGAAGVGVGVGLGVAFALAFTAGTRKRPTGDEPAAVDSTAPPGPPTGDESGTGRQATGTSDAGRPVEDAPDPGSTDPGHPDVERGPTDRP
ncbi:hypothetical protein GA0070616_3640 [Micromonospora nigra]|uniref:Uncharacterized protein n=1 Tax=Micromonospora nigra TaxID=145857 RepID=A0A1C6SFF6_9ACTN|nr:hypothetical protein [Micromonospora nigra]SCL28161.1 hypothetical protein GA0070616_3640 [Micromonospora nigra]